MANLVTDVAASKRASEPVMDLSWDGTIQKQTVRDLYERSRKGTVMMLVMCAVIGWSVAPAFDIDANVLTAFAILVAINVARFLLALVTPERREQLASVRTQFAVFATGAGLSSVALGALVVLTWPILDPARIAIVAVITSGVVSGGVMNLGFSPIVYMIYMLPTIGALFLMAITDQRPPWGAGILATSFALYAGIVLAISLDQRRTHRLAIQLASQLSDLAVRDSLTKLHNRRFLQEFMTLQAAKIARDATDLENGRQPTRDSAIGIFVLDLDFFKQVNDTYGHAAGDVVLKQTADALVRAMRKTDNLVRWGGEEFVAIAWVKQLHDVRIVAEKLRKAIEVTQFKLPDGRILQKTASIGFCSMPFATGQPRLSWEQVLSIADAALYVAKAEGRNRWVGVAIGKAPWADSETTCAVVSQDLLRAEEMGLVKLDRMSPSFEVTEG